MQTGYRVLAAAVGWFVIGLQYYLTVGKADGDFVLAATRLLSFFTILTNILVALAMTLPWLVPESRFGALFSRPSVHHRRLGDLLRDPTQALESGRAAISRRYDRALCRTRPLWRRLAHLRAEGDGLGKIGALLAAFPPGVCGLFADPRRGDGLLSLSFPLGDAARLCARVAEYERSDGRLCRARPDPCRRRPRAWGIRGAQRKLTRVNSLGICWPQDRPRRFGDTELSRAREPARKGLESMHHPDHRGQKAVPVPVASDRQHVSRGQVGAKAESEAAHG
jgi:hypothetical protein